MRVHPKGASYLNVMCRRAGCPSISPYDTVSVPRRVLPRRPDAILRSLSRSSSNSSVGSSHVPVGAAPQGSFSFGTPPQATPSRTIGSHRSLNGGSQISHTQPIWLGNASPLVKTGGHTQMEGGDSLIPQVRGHTKFALWFPHFDVRRIVCIVFASREQVQPCARATHPMESGLRW